MICESNSPEETFQDRPVLIAEVLSKQTRRTDETEKKEAYLSIPTVACYVLVEQAKQELVIYRRTQEGFVEETLVGKDARLCVPRVRCRLAARRNLQRCQC